LVIFALLDPDPYSNYGSGSNGPIEYGSNPDPDPVRIRNPAWINIGNADPDTNPGARKLKKLNKKRYFQP
jgi:hypothetical protein